MKKTIKAWAMFNDLRNGHVGDILWFTIRETREETISIFGWCWGEGKGERRETFGVIPRRITITVED